MMLQTPRQCNVDGEDFLSTKRIREIRGFFFSLYQKFDALYGKQNVCELGCQKYKFYVQKEESYGCFVASGRILLLFVSFATLHFVFLATAQIQASSPAPSPSNYYSHPSNGNDEDDTEFEVISEGGGNPYIYHTAPDERNIRTSLASEEKTSFGSSTEFDSSISNLSQQTTLTRFFFEITAGILFLFVLLHAYRGYLANEAIASAYVDRARSIYKQQFTCVGFKSSFFYKISYNRFESFASGRNHCHFLYTILECEPRQCFWRSSFARMCGLGEKNGDLLTLEFLLPSGDPVVLALCRRIDQKSMLNDNWDIGEFGKVRSKSLDIFGNNIVCLSDTNEAFENLINNRNNVIQVINSNIDFFRYIYLSDLCLSLCPSASNTLKGMTTSPYNNAISRLETMRVFRICFALPSRENIDIIQSFLKMAFFLVDAAYSFQLSDKARESSRKMRQAFEKEQMKELDDELEKKRKEKKKQEEDNFDKMSPAQQRKAEEKKYKKELKQSRSRVKVMRA